jgi:hypothetical protein
MVSALGNAERGTRPSITSIHVPNSNPRATEIMKEIDNEVQTLDQPEHLLHLSWQLKTPLISDLFPIVEQAAKSAPAKPSTPSLESPNQLCFTYQDCYNSEKPDFPTDQKQKVPRISLRRTQRSRIRVFRWKWRSRVIRLERKQGPSNSAY